MLPVLITIDTEYSSGLYRSGEGRDRAANFARTIACRGSKGEAGIHHQIAVMDRHGITGTFFVDPMPALVWGQEAIDAVVHPILEAGHEVQLHCHTEWLELATGDPLGPERGDNLKEFSRAAQVRILAFARDRLVEAGAPAPTMFRAGNYGANDDTLRALAQVGIARDTSFAPGFEQSVCAIDLPMGRCEPIAHCGVEQWPIAAIQARGGWRHGQLTALSLAEMRAAILHAAEAEWPAFVLVSHSFELFNRARGEPNPLLMRRFAGLCEWLGECDLVETRGSAALEMPLYHPPLPLLPYSFARTARRVAEQVLASRF